MSTTTAERIASLAPMLVASGHPHDYELPPRALLGDDQRYQQIHRGLYLPAQRWQQLSAEDRHLCRVLGVLRAANSPPVFSHISAAVLLGLPVYGAIDVRVHLTTGEHGAGRPSAEAVRHRSALCAEDVVEVAGVRCTSPERTILDLARSVPAETALAAADGFLRSAFRVGRHVDSVRFSAWQVEMEQRISRLCGRNGARAARQVFGLADPRIDSVLESLSHLQLHRLGFDVELQVPVPSPTGGAYYVDFEFLGLDLFGECDGKQKYTDPGLRNGSSADELVYREKQRQDWISGRENKRVIRWGLAEVRSARALAQRLRAFNVPIPRPPG